MKITITFKHLDHTPALDEKIRSKTLKLEKYLEGVADVKWTCYVKDGIHHADAKCIGPSFEYQASADSDTLYKTLDLVISKLEKQIKKKKEMWKDKIHHKHDKMPSDFVAQHKEDDFDEYEEDEFLAADIAVNRSRTL